MVHGRYTEPRERTKKQAEQLVIKSLLLYAVKKKSWLLYDRYTLYMVERVSYKDKYFLNTGFI